MGNSKISAQIGSSLEHFYFSARFPDPPWAPLNLLDTPLLSSTRL